ncbi:AAA family ATPase [soil metagenome]
MEMTDEQYAIIQSRGDIRINAVAGSGKTTTIIEYARTRPRESRILYLAFNKSVKTEAIRKFKAQGIDNVSVETAHSLAYRNIVFKYNYKVRNQNLTSNELVEILSLRANEESLSEFIFANHIIKFLAYFCNSDKQKVQELNYLDVVADKKSKLFVTTYYKYIESKTRELLSQMDKGEIEITHDFYLKKFQLSEPELPFDYILFDEAQDASAAMLDIFLKQTGTKVIVGDTHQQIYGWRFAVNSLEKANFQTFHLSTSFRFSQDIANLAIEVVNWKKHFLELKALPIKGIGNINPIQTKAVIARTNLGLLLKAIEYVHEKKNIQHLYFEGNINSYTYADEGTSLYDVLSLYNGRSSRVKDKLIKSMKNISELEQYIDKTDDVQLGMMLEIVKKYGNKIPEILKLIKEKHVEDKDQAEMIFSTVHRCKGMEYDAIQLVNDFITEKKLLKVKDLPEREELNMAKLSEEVNLLYVAITRTKNSIHIPEVMMPFEFPESQQIFIERKTIDEEIEEAIANAGTLRSRKTKSGRIKQTEKKVATTSGAKKAVSAYQPWTKELDDELTEKYSQGLNIAQLAVHFERTKGAIVFRIAKLELSF